MCDGSATPEVVKRINTNSKLLLLQIHEAVKKNNRFIIAIRKQIVLCSEVTSEINKKMLCKQTEV